jgi:hypothetical protein
LNKGQRRLQQQLLSLALLSITSVLATGCRCRNNISPADTPIVKGSYSGAQVEPSSPLQVMALKSFYESRSIAEIVHSSEDDNENLKLVNAELARRISDKEEQLRGLHNSYWITGPGRSELFKAQEPWKELRELDALFAARGEHGYSLARYLYLQEKLRITEERIEYVKKKIR